MLTKVIIFGASGDLGKRKLIPAMENLIDKKLITDVEVIGIGRRKINVEEYLQDIFKDSWYEKNITKVFDFYDFDITNQVTIDNLYKKIDINNPNQNVIMFLSLPPNNMEDYINTLGMNKFNKPNVKILIEKPFGDNYESAKRLFNVINSYFKDQNVFLLDHYLCKKFMQNFNNFKLLDANFYKKFNSEYIESININALEAIDIQGRVNFYEQTGALKDFVVNHMMEMLCTVISLPKNLKNEEIIKSRIAACKQLFLINDDTITAQYLGYKDEVNNQASITETFIKIHLRSNDKKWTNVDFFLTSGKALSEKSNTIVIKYKNGEILNFELFPQNVFPNSFDNQPLNFIFNNSLLDCYEGVFFNAINDNKIVFATIEEILHNWQVYDELLVGWKNGKKHNLSYNKNAKYQTIVKN